MPMNKPQFTTNPYRVSRLVENYNAGLERESLPINIREKLDCECLVVSRNKLKFLHQNAMEGYSPEMKNQKVMEYNHAHPAEVEKKNRSFFRFL